MKTKIAIVTVLGAVAVLATACGGDDQPAMGMTTPPPPTTQSLDTAGVLALAKVTSETTEPFAVDDGAVTLTDASDTTEPVDVDAT